MNFQEFADTNGLAFTYAKTDSNPHMPDPPRQPAFKMDHYIVGIYKGEDLFTLNYSKGLGHEGKPPTIDEVLYCLFMDASTLDQSTDFDDWCVSLGYDTDSREAERIFTACMKQTDRLEVFLGEDLLNDLLMCEED